jgi:hypothetical protein
MKQYTTSEQTAKLIELGLEKPKSIEKVTYIEQYGCGYEAAYSIGELIGMLQKQVYQIEDSCIPCDLNIHYDGGTWLIVFICERDGRFKTEMFELIDALYDMVVKLKEEGVL